MPKEAFLGLLAGGLRIAEVKEETKETEASGEGVAIKNEFAYVVGVVASNDRSAVKPDLDLLDVFADQLNYRNVISANLQNFTPTFVNHLEVEATVQKEGENDILYRARQEQMQMAPNSNFNFPISLEGDRFRSGEYLLKMTARSGEEEWQWERKFTIDADEARALNREDVTLQKGINWWLVVAISLVILLLVIIVWLLIQRRKEKNDKEDKYDEN
jgi:cbb3-type cytochrome oxidase subunit 3